MICCHKWRKACSLPPTLYGPPSPCTNTDDTFPGPSAESTQLTEPSRKIEGFVLLDFLVSLVFCQRRTQGVTLALFFTQDYISTYIQKIMHFSYNIFEYLQNLFTLDISRPTEAHFTKTPRDFFLSFSIVSHPLPCLSHNSLAGELSLSYELKL